MTQAGWYLRRAVPWVPVLGCCGAAVLAAGAAHQWPSTVVVMLPAVLGCCAAAASFVFDERETAVASVTPRAPWRRRVRLGAAALPLALWTAVAAWPPDGLPRERLDWWLTGLVAVLVSSGAAGLTSGHDSSAPGGLLSGLVALAVFVPLVVGSVVETASPYPFEGFTDGVRAWWLAAGALGLAACLQAVRPARQPSWWSSR